MKPLDLLFHAKASCISMFATSIFLMGCVHEPPIPPSAPPKRKTLVRPQEVVIPPTMQPTPAAPASTAVPTLPPPVTATDGTIAPAPQIEQAKDAHPLPPVTTDCEVLPKFPNDEPVFIQSLGVLLTRISSPCRTGFGAMGHRKNAGWMTMGFPCTGGEGRIDWKGTNYNAPKMVSYLLETSCPMAPSDQSKIVEAVSREIGISRSAPMIAFTPFVVQYWEVPGYEDADATFSVELRSNKGLAGAWTNFIKQNPLKVFLVGRENAWVPGNFMYGVDAEVIWVSKNRFRLKVTGARPLKGVELDAVRTRCEALRPERECSRVF